MDVNVPESTWEPSHRVEGMLPAPTETGAWNMLVERSESGRIQRTLCLVWVENIRPLAITRDGEHPRRDERILGWRKSTYPDAIIQKVFGPRPPVTP